MYLLAANPCRVLTREEILDTLWGPEHGVHARAIDQQIRSLHARLQAVGPQPLYISTVTGHGSVSPGRCSLLMTRRARVSQAPR